MQIDTRGQPVRSFGAFCNDGMQMKHYGTCNDGVGKGQCGGELVVMSPGGGALGQRRQCAIGNFALFGATGGRLFVQGRAGDRFAVRNSGATAVVEGVGDFCCEYMTNGAILNLGTFGKGFGNGMSGGFAYQYDPYRSRPRTPPVIRCCSAPSLTKTKWRRCTSRRADHAALAPETTSRRAAWLLENWGNRVSALRLCDAALLLLYQDGGEILKAKTRKDLGRAPRRWPRIRLPSSNQRRAGKTIADGAVPAYGATDTQEMFVLLNNYTVLSFAQLALGNRRKAQRWKTRQSRKRFATCMTEDFALVSNCSVMPVRPLRTTAMMSWQADRRQAYVGLQSRADAAQHSLHGQPATYGWIIYQDACNREVLGHLPDFEELFARAALPEIAAAVGNSPDCAAKED